MRAVKWVVTFRMRTGRKPLILWGCNKGCDKCDKPQDGNPLTHCVYRKKMAGVTGLEPAASGVTGRRSNQTELRPPESGKMVGDTRIELVTYGL